MQPAARKATPTAQALSAMDLMTSSSVASRTGEPFKRLRGAGRASEIAAAEADQRVPGRGAVGHDPAERDDRAVTLDHLLEPAVYDAHGVDQGGRAGVE